VAADSAAAVAVVVEAGEAVKNKRLKHSFFKQVRRYISWRRACFCQTAFCQERQNDR
jgi:hypothetical protein